MGGVHVNVSNFERAETDRMFAAMQSEAGGVNTLLHFRVPTPLDRQTVIRMNRDTLYSAAIVDISEGATVTIPDSGDRYVSVMIVNEDHYINRVFHAAGEHALTTDEFDTPYVCVAARILVDPTDPADVEAVNALQDSLAIHAESARAFAMPDYDEASLDSTRQALLALAKGTDSFGGAFGRKSEVNPVMHLLGTAAGWGGLPPQEAFYTSVSPDLPVGEYQLTVKDVPVDAFWSISLYNADGFFEPSDQGGNSVNNITATPEADGSVTVHFGGCSAERPNCLALMDGWNYTVRLYRPRPEVLDGSWTFPAIQPS
jgi:hypothetical protein